MKGFSKLFLLLVALFAGLFLQACVSARGNGVSLGADGVCGSYESPAGGRVKACYNPLTRVVVLSGAYKGQAYRLAYDSSSREAVGTLPDGTRVKYGKLEGLTFEAGDGGTGGASLPAVVPVSGGGLD